MGGLIKPFGILSHFLIFFMVNINCNQIYNIEDIIDYVSLRDNYTCQKCGKGGYELAHIIPKSLGGVNSPNNLILLCGKCHKEVEKLLSSWEQYFKKIVLTNEKRYRESFIKR